MEYYVTTVLKEHIKTSVPGDVLYLDERKIKIAGIEHSLYYGDIVRCGDFSYYINANTITEDEHEYTVEGVWDLRDGEIPDDGKKYFLIVSLEENYSYELKNYLDYHYNIMSRNGRVLTIHENNGMFYDKTTERARFYHYKEHGIHSGGVYENYVKTVEEHQEEKLQNLREDIVTDHFTTALTEQIFQDNQTIFEILKGKDGQDGIDGQDGEDGVPGRDGADGDVGGFGATGLRGDAGDPGRDGKIGETGKQGNIGEAGETGAQGYRGPIGETGQKGNNGHNGSPGRNGIDGRDGEQGPPGKTLIEEVEDPKTAKTFAEFRKEFDYYRKVDRIYKDRLNIQLGSLGGGGSSKILDNDDVLFNKASQLANNDFLVFDKTINKFVANNLVTIINTIKAELEVQYDKLVDEQPMGANTFTFIGEAAPGSNTTTSVWRIKRIAEYANGYLEIIWANDTELFDKDWTIRETYTYTV